MILKFILKNKQMKISRNTVTATQKDTSFSGLEEQETGTNIYKNFSIPIILLKKKQRMIILNTDQRVLVSIIKKEQIIHIFL